jgi:hypothetical protein
VDRRSKPVADKQARGIGQRPDLHHVRVDPASLLSLISSSTAKLPLEACSRSDASLWLAQVAPARPCFGAVTFVNL